MTTQPTYHALNLANRTQFDAIATLWNEACGPTLAISNQFVTYNTHPVTGGRQVGQIAYHGEQPIGFVLTSTLSGEPSVAPGDVGWIDAMAVTPNTQNQGVGATLLTWAEQWLASQGRHSVRFGASQRPFAPGLPVELNKLSFFSHRGYTSEHTSWDTAADLAMYETPDPIRKAQEQMDASVRPGQKGEEPALLEFLRREFPGRWRFEFEEFLRVEPGAHGRVFSDYMLLWTERGVDGFCQLTFEDSRRPMERFFPYQLPRPWGQLGSVGVSAEQRGRGYGLAVVDAGLRRLRDNGSMAA